ncbi:uncharacterized protein EI90DRAFT_3130522 [Cantharellus anzutake]|uniref:uncharacterized protein n=1 Tax=Cantharellus anzutake TaxID=1750568 RepID=UPI001904D802|nr:uncharacterized protein EI90DRAFT_3130522 [Cantharellus anzutake]KAF8322993.1 hypothetical protein EI90DRAFT_3130522 [Cantharellus anzutake]
MSDIVPVFQHALTKYKDKLTGKPRLSMEWVPANYLKLTIKHCVVIDMTNYPDGKLIEPKLANVNHLCQVLDGWKNNKIKWVKLTDEQVEERHEELAALTSTGTEVASTLSSRVTDGRVGEEGLRSSVNVSSGSMAPATSLSPSQCDATQIPTQPPAEESRQAVTAIRGHKHKAMQSSEPQKKKQPTSAGMAGLQLGRESG